MIRTRIFNVCLAALVFAAVAACSAHTDAQSGGPPVPFKLGTFERNGQAFIGLVLKDTPDRGPRTGQCRFRVGQRVGAEDGGAGRHEAADRGL